MDRLVVIGAGESGMGAALLGHQLGWDVWLSDYGTIADVHKRVLISLGISFEEGIHNENEILSAKLVVKSPGVSPGVPIMKAIKNAGIPVISEIEWGFRHTDATIVGITGSNGKTTTTLLTYHLLKAAGLNVGLAGNIGTSFAKSVATSDYDLYVLEISSFQLENIEELRCDIAMLLNITADHLDRYDGDLMKYAQAKFNIINNQGKDDLFIFNGRDDVTNKILKDMDLNQRLLPVLEPIVMEDFLYLGGDVKFDISQFGLEGKHNLTNLTFALLTALDLGVSHKALQKGINTFQNAPHRMERVRTLDGVEYINDSKATNVAAVYYALESMRKPTIWIVGGVDKGNDYSIILDLVRKNVKSIICLGKDNTKLFMTFDKLGIPLKGVQSAEEAVLMARAMADSGDTVLLSPACASFDLFDNYMHRGDLFREAVNALE